MFSNFLIVLIALLLDGFQILIGFAFTILGATAGTAAGLAAGVAACSWTGSDAVVAGCATVLGAAGTTLNLIAAPVAGPVAALIGLVIGTIASLTIGTAIVFWLAMKGMFYPRYVIPAYVGEVVPGFELIPAWTFLVLRSIFRKKAEEKKNISSGVTNIKELVETTRAGSEKAAEKIDRGAERAGQAIRDIVPKARQPQESVA